MAASKTTRKSTRNVRSSQPNASEAYEPASSDAEEPQPKKRKTAASKASSKALLEDLFRPDATAVSTTAHPPLRRHSLQYHRPLLLVGSAACDARKSLLDWFDSVSTARNMPWRKPWVDPTTFTDPAALRSTLQRRAYEVWISEIMLQQTRVTTVIDYWNRWMAKWPTIQDLAAASPDEVLSAWRGLGYYSRASRIHEAAKIVVGDAQMDGLLPQDVVNLEQKVPGVGRYTAGAVSAIVFGHAAPMVDGNVLRVLSRQLGLLGNVKSDKAVIDMLWAAADALVKAVARDETDITTDNVPVSNRPGRWGQALMELGSTVCTPKPNCAECPITSTCRVYAEGQSIAAGTKHKKPVGDIEDCELCHPLEEAAGEDDTATSATTVSTAVKTSAKQSTLAMFRFTSTSTEKKPPSSSKIDTKQSEIIANHARKFPLKVVKKAVREEETVVCAIRQGDQYLISRRPEKGLLAGMWELPSRTLLDAEEAKAKARKAIALNHVLEMCEAGSKGPPHSSISVPVELGSVPWLFSHLKLTMHVYLINLDDSTDIKLSDNQRWASAAEIDDESMGTGMHKCWTLVKEAGE